MSVDALVKRIRVPHLNFPFETNALPKFKAGAVWPGNPAAAIISAAKLRHPLSWFARAMNRALESDHRSGLKARRFENQKTAAKTGAAILSKMAEPGRPKLEQIA